VILDHDNTDVHHDQAKPGSPCFPHLAPDGKHGPRARDRPVPPGPPQTHDDLVFLGRVALDLVMVGVVLSLVSVGVFIAAGAAVAVLTLLRARSRARRRHSRLSRLNLGYHGTGIDEIDEALDRILAEERSASWLP
jgi:hypothetical protein